MLITPSQMRVSFLTGMVNLGEEQDPDLRSSYAQRRFGWFLYADRIEGAGSEFKEKISNANAFPLHIIQDHSRCFKVYASSPRFDALKSDEVIPGYECTFTHRRGTSLKETEFGCRWVRSKRLGDPETDKPFIFRKIVHERQESQEAKTAYPPVRSFGP